MAKKLMRSNPNPYLFSHLNEDERKYARNEKVSYFLELTSKQDDLSIHSDLYLRLLKNLAHT